MIRLERFSVPYERLRLMSNTDKEKPVRVSDQPMRILLSIIGSISLLLATWFAQQVQHNAVETSVLSQRVTTIEAQLPKQISELKSDMRNEFNEVKQMIRAIKKENQ